MSSLPPTAGCLFTTVVRPLASSKKFAFLPPHGRELAQDEELTFFGSIGQVAQSHGQGVCQRYERAWAQAIADGELEVKETPCNIVYDDTDAASYMIVSSGGTVGTASPAWGSSVA
jgi:hypothetical protein